MSTKFGKLLYDSGTVAAGAAIDSGVLDVRGASHLLISVLNFAGDAGRVTVATLYLNSPAEASSGALTLSTAALGTNRTIGIGDGLTTAAGINYDAYAIPLPAYIKFTVAAAGTQGLRILVMARTSDSM